jgi:hypothetical protein
VLAVKRSHQLFVGNTVASPARSSQKIACAPLRLAMSTAKDCFARLSPLLQLLIASSDSYCALQCSSPAVHLYVLAVRPPAAFGHSSTSPLPIPSVFLLLCPALCNHHALRAFSWLPQPVALARSIRHSPLSAWPARRDSVTPGFRHGIASFAAGAFTFTAFFYFFNSKKTSTLIKVGPTPLLRKIIP